MSALTPREIVSELDRHIIGHPEAKRAVAIALRNRWRRQQTPEGLREEITPKNILMIGPTGVGKTEIARRLARLAQAPFLKIEATKFTEVGYVGRDVDQIVRDLIEISIKLVREKNRITVRAKAEASAEDRLIEALVGNTATDATKESFRKKLRDGILDDKEVEISIDDNSQPIGMMDLSPGQGAMFNLNDMFKQAMGGRKKTLKAKVTEAIPLLITQESDRLLDSETLIQDAIKLAENDGIVFLDEIDKVASRSHGSGGEVSREGVQRDLLPLIEGTTVSTKHGPVKTDHILFIASGAFHVAKPSDLLPELQGRLPIRVELKALTKDDFVRILKEPEHNLIKQNQALLATENINIQFTDEAISLMANTAAQVNATVENIGARRLQTVVEKVLEDLSFKASDMNAQDIVIDEAWVAKALGDLATNSDLSRYIL
jgi:ATP-dependent HslUV protease ATP-binding subunit HslU